MTLHHEEKTPAPGNAPQAPARRPGDPPGMGAVRRFFRHPFFRGVWLWVRAIGRGLQATWKWLDQNAGPIARGIEKAGNTAVRVSEGAVKVGQAAGEIGGKVSAWGRDRRDAGGVRLRRIGEGMRRFGKDAVRIGTRSGDVAEGVEDLGEGLVSLVGDDGEPGRRARRVSEPKPKIEVRPRHRLPRRAPAILPPSAVVPESDEPDKADLGGELPEVFRDRIRALGKRKRSKPLRQLILDICADREWTTVGDLADWLGMDASNLQKRHLRPLLKSGQLRLRYPGNRSHPDQAYGAGA